MRRDLFFIMYTTTIVWLAAVTSLWMLRLEAYADVGANRGHHECRDHKKDDTLTRRNFAKRRVSWQKIPRITLRHVSALTTALKRGRAPECAPLFLIRQIFTCLSAAPIPGFEAAYESALAPREIVPAVAPAIHPHDLQDQESVSAGGSLGQERLFHSAQKRP